MSQIHYLLPLALLWDWIIGDPRTRFHPVVQMGALIAFLERKLRSPLAAPNSKRMAGSILVLSVLILTYFTARLATELLALLPPLPELLGGALLLSFVISPRSLAQAGREIKALLEAGDLDQARGKVSWIVGRDTAGLNIHQVSRATVETVAENIVDGIISPLFYALLGGLPLAFVYRAVNTMDSMLGYKNEKYMDFGMVAARTDDVFNYIPARITGILLVAACFPLRLSGLMAVKMMLRDAAKHPSPNSGIPEAAVAGALGIQLGGLNYYGGKPSQRALMGDRLNPIEPGHIEATIRLMYVTTWLFTLTAAAIANM
ncbi:adenosylcobinamide-phosphate synthase CbiB [Acetonema longum]|uniref:Cobalamin biosynthesis protein CobD n=1 Tax=Acetonema longum DSM 6540 TaxID=1009370 RepID=F7NPX8_9FIRM|nr:adenosylcobinamide-phosphate synthase CbiB [Acetonema longum]EGO61969.1 adenosylcobinamide-phosphate synthase [Acetonema longum DSM 6540]